MAASAERRVALVTGASSGIGAATVRALAAAGFATVSAARRVERIEALAAEVGGRAEPLDVTDPARVAELASALPRVDVIVHSAGGALGLEPVAEADEEKWREMWESNVAGVMRVTKALLPALRDGDRSRTSSILGSVAGVEVYPGGGGYTAAKHAVHALAQTLRLELLARPDQGHRGRAGHGRDRVLARPLRRRRRAGRPRSTTASSRSPPRTSPT